MRGRSLELYFVNGNPDGMLTAEVFNWTGHVLAIPRQQIAEGLRRAEASFTGVYLLVGETSEGRPLLYIGESEDVASRLRNHDASKEWWSRVVIITSAANNLHKAHVKYLEARLVETAREVAHAVLDNQNQPPRSSLNEAARANMEAFLDVLHIVLPAIRIDSFVLRTRGNTAPGESVTASITPPEVFELHAARAGISARAVLAEGEFVVQAGSQARASWHGVDYATYRGLYEELRAAGDLIPEPDGLTCRFPRNYAFPSPSAASSVILGRASSGPKEWRHCASGLTYKEWENRLLAAEEGMHHG